MKLSRIISLILAVVLFASCEKIEVRGFRGEWKDTPDGVWAGPDFWANRLQDWHVRNGRLECTGIGPMRTVHLLSRRIADKRGNISATVTIYRTGGEDRERESAAGLLIGAGGSLDFRAASLVFHSYGPGAGIFAGLDGAGNLFIRDFEKEDSFFARNNRNRIEWTEARLIVSVVPARETSTIHVIAVNPFTNNIIDKIEVSRIPSDRFTGNIAIVSHPYSATENVINYAFSDLRVGGSRVLKNKSHSPGPVISAQYTLSRNNLKITAQLFPLSHQEDCRPVLELLENNEWKAVDTAAVERPSYTASFRITGWNRTEDTEYRISCRLKSVKRKHYYLRGIIRHDPVDRNEIRMLSLSCNEHIIRPDGNEYGSIDGGSFNYLRSLLFPHAVLVENLKKFKPDILYFAGDQVYETASPTPPDLQNPGLDYLYKWYLWCLTFRELTATVPSIIIPDDHDVYHGNLWGEGGKPVPSGFTGAAAQDAGGYKMAADFVNMVQATQTSHLPDPVDPLPVLQGINVYFTECNIGGISIAVIEDRKFKSAPAPLFPEADIYNGWPRDTYWNARYSSRNRNAVLIGKRQLDFLETWAGDWSGGAWMKVVVSQTLFANLATIPLDSLTDAVVPYMVIPDSGNYLTGDRLATDFDSNGWPQHERDQAIRIFRKAFAIHVAGDQHLGSTVQYGVDEFRDAGFAIVSPATGNIWPRHWFPPSAGLNRKPGWPENYGDFEDGFGNKITVHAVANPHKSTIEPVRHNQYSTGYSAITFFRDTREIEMVNWPYYADPQNDKPFPSWPVRITQQDNYGRNAAGWLPEIRVEGLKDPVFRVIREYTGELIYSLRISGDRFQPKVFETGNYRIEIGEPDRNLWQKIEKSYPTSFREREPLTVRF